MTQTKKTNTKTPQNKRELLKNKKVKQAKMKSRLKIIFLSLFTLGAIGLSIVLLFVASIIKDAPKLNYDDLVPEGYTSFIRDQNGEVIQELSTGESNRIYVDIDQIPEYVKDAFIAIEDERFYSHNGIDLRGILRAVFVNLKSGSLSEGASTITQQVIKNNILTTEKSFNRKIIEQYLAVQAEKELDKDQILELYLNTAALGRGTNGVQSASNRYFGKDVSELSLAEAAVIAGITQRPTDYDPVINPENNQKRQIIILDRMFDQGMISASELKEAKDEDVYAHIQVTNQIFEEQSDYSYFVDEVIRRVALDLEEEKGFTSGQAINMVYRGGLDIYTTQDMAMQEILDNSFANDENFPTFEDDYNVMLMYSLSYQTSDGPKNHYEEVLLQSDEEAAAYIETTKSELLIDGNTLVSENSLLIPQPQAAMIIIDQHTGHVKAITGGRGEKVGNAVLNRATMTKRQPGSTFKVLAAYLPAIDAKGLTLGTVFDDVPYSLNLGGGATYEPSNWYSSSTFNYWGLSTIRQGIEWSMNIVTIKTMADVGVQTGFDYLLDLGFTSLVESETIDGKVFSDKNIVLPLGGLTHGVSLIELTGAYAAIANEGIYIEPTFYTKILDHNGDVMILNEPETHSAMKKTSAFLLTNAMEDVVKTGTATVARFDNMAIAGKTGTTSDSKDLAFIGFTPYYTAGIWMGHDTPEKMIHDKSYHKLIWKDVMSQIHESLEPATFTMPDGIVKKNICIESGKLAVDGLCNLDPRGSTIRSEYFEVGTEPKESCDVHIKVTLCETSGLLPTIYCPEDTLVDKIYIKRPVPLVPESWDPANPPRIKDYAYEFPITMVGELCTVHTGEVKPTVTPTPSSVTTPSTDTTSPTDPNTSTETPLAPAPVDATANPELPITIE